MNQTPAGNCVNVVIGLAFGIASLALYIKCQPDVTMCDRPLDMFLLVRAVTRTQPVPDIFSSRGVRFV